jgi:hypothetical protein
VTENERMRADGNMLLRPSARCCQTHRHHPFIEWSFADTRGLDDFTRAEWNVVMHSAGETEDGWFRVNEGLPTMTLLASVAELGAIVRSMVCAGVFTGADQVYVSAVRTA